MWYRIIPRWPRTFRMWWRHYLSSSQILCNDSKKKNRDNLMVKSWFSLFFHINRLKETHRSLVDGRNWATIPSLWWWMLFSKEPRPCLTTGGLYCKSAIFQPWCAHRQCYREVLYVSNTVPTSQDCLITDLRARGLSKHPRVTIYSPLT